MVPWDNPNPGDTGIHFNEELVLELNGQSIFFQVQTAFPCLI